MARRVWRDLLDQWMVKLRVEVEFDSAYARARKSEAVTFPSLDHSRIKIMFADETPSESSVLEELAHVSQERRGHFADAPDVRIQTVLREIEVKECLDRLADRLQIPQSQRATTRELLRRDREELERLKEWLQ